MDNISKRGNQEIPTTPRDISSHILTLNQHHDRPEQNWAEAPLGESAQQTNHYISDPLHHNQKGRVDSLSQPKKQLKQARKQQHRINQKQAYGK
jgi:hypothetical protein